MEFETQDIFGWAATCLTALFYVSLITPFFKIFKGEMKYQDAPIFVIYVSYININKYIIYFKKYILKWYLYFMGHLWKYYI